MKRTLLISSLTLISAVFAGNAAFALTAQNEAEVEFTFAPSLTLSVSDSDLIIENLMPGTSDISNTVDVTVTTNAVYGYSLLATTGNTTYPTRNLVKDNNNYLESVATDASISTLANDTWGYTLDNGSTYSGLPLYTGASKELNSSYEPVNATTGKTTFAIGAKASSTKASGNYNNVVNFTAVAKVTPPPTIQSITAATCPTTRTLTIDSRDGQKYYIQKIITGETTLCWMTSNLNIAGGTTLTPATSNVTSDYTLPVSSIDGFDDWTKAFVYNDSTYGGYYSYKAATAGTDPTTDGDNAPSDICPKGWRLPTRDEFGTLKTTYNTANTLTVAPWYGKYGGNMVYGPALDAGSTGYYWSSTAKNSVYAYRLYFGGSGVNTENDMVFRGFSVRCIADV